MIDSLTTLRCVVHLPSVNRCGDSYTYTRSQLLSLPILSLFTCPFVSDSADQGQIQEYDEVTKRYTVMVQVMGPFMNQITGVRLEASHLLQMVSGVELVGITSQPQLNGRTGQLRCTLRQLSCRNVELLSLTTCIPRRPRV